MSRRRIQTGTGSILTLCLTTAVAMAQVNWSLDGTLPQAVDRHGVAVLGGDILVFGGHSGPNQVSDTYLYHPGGGWDETPADMPQGRADMGYAIHQGRVLSVAGYLTGAGVWGRTVEVWSYDPDTDSWSSETSLSYHRDSNAAVGLGGYVYTIGGHHEDTGHGFSLSIVERYDGASWQTVSPLIEDDTPSGMGRERLGAVVVGGKIYAVGGLSYDKLTHPHEVGGWLEVYDPVTNTWDNSLPTMPTPRTQFAIAAVGTRIYTVGGYTDAWVTESDAVEYFDTVDGQWHLDTPFPFPVAGARAVAIGSRVYVTGGRNDTGALDTVYVMTFSIPAVSAWGLSVMTLLVLGAGTVVLARRRALTTG